MRGHLYSENEFGLRRSPTDIDPVEGELEEQLDKERFMFLTVDELEFEAYLGSSLLGSSLLYCTIYYDLRLRIII